MQAVCEEPRGRRWRRRSSGLIVPEERRFGPPPPPPPLAPFPFSFWSGANFDPGTLNLTGWWLGAKYGATTVGTWDGTASLGTSGGHALVTSSGLPVAGPTFNGKASVSFSHANLDALTTAVPDTGFITAAAYSGWAVVESVSINRDPALPSAFTDVVLRTGGYNWSVGFKKTGPLWVVSQSADGGSTWLSASTTAATGSLHLYSFRYDGTTMQGRFDGGAWATQAVGHIGFTGGGFVMADANLTANVCEVATSQLFFSDATFDKIHQYSQHTYGTP